MTIQVENIKSNPYFFGLSQSALDVIGKFIFEKTAEKGEMLLFDGEPAGALYFVISGVVKVFKTSADGKEQILNLIRPGESFNDVPVFNGGTNLANADAMVPAVLYGIKKVSLEVILRDYPQVAVNIIQVLSQRVQHLVTLVEDLSFRHVTSRVAKLLLEYAPDGEGQRPKLTQQEMAALTGTAREVVGRSLKTLEEDGLIRLDRHRLVITNRKALGEMAGVIA